MRTHKRLLISLAALAAAGLVGCLNAPESVSSYPVTESEIQAAISRPDSLKPPRPIVCDTLKARLAVLDSTAPRFAGLSNAVARVCRVRPPHPDSLRPREPKPPRPDSVRADSARPKPDSLRPVPPVKPDSARPQPPKPPKKK